MESPPARALVHLDALKENIRFIKEKTGGRRILAPVKADAYGHGAVEIARAAIDEGVHALGVARVGEAALLRKNGISAPIVLFSPILPVEIPKALLFNVSLFVSSAEEICLVSEACARLGKKAGVPGVHLKIDTGMGRIGCRPEDAPVLAALIYKKGLRLEGCATHLAVSDTGAQEDAAFTKKQIERFAGVADAVRRTGFETGLLHTAASGGVLCYPESYFDMVRPGILLYGYAPSAALSKEARVRPVMELRASVLFVKKVEKGESVSYGRRWTADVRTTIATLGIGYADGLPRAASGKFGVLINGRVCTQVGTICMDQCMVDIGQETCATGDESVIFGGEAPHNAASLAGIAGTIPYEVLCGISRRAERVYCA